MNNRQGKRTTATTTTILSRWPSPLWISCAKPRVRYIIYHHNAKTEHWPCKWRLTMGPPPQIYIYIYTYRQINPFIIWGGYGMLGDIRTSGFCTAWVQVYTDILVELVPLCVRQFSGYRPWESYRRYLCCIIVIIIIAYDEFINIGAPLSHTPADPLGSCARSKRSSGRPNPGDPHHNKILTVVVYRLVSRTRGTTETLVLCVPILVLSFYHLSEKSVYTNIIVLNKKNTLLWIWICHILSDSRSLAENLCAWLTCMFNNNLVSSVKK